MSVFEDGGPRRPVGLVAFEQKWLHQLRRMGSWLRELPKPVGLMACNDVRAYQVSNACREAGLEVPDQVAIIGVDNDPTLCELATPPLTSIDPNAAKVGYEAAALLHRLIEANGPPPQEVLIEPTGIVSRRSSDVLAIPDRDVVEAVRCVRDRACQGFTVEDLVEHTAVSRSTLDRWFSKHLGHSVSDEITRVRIERVKELLATTNLVVEELSRLAGFSHPETMYRLFKESSGQTPSDFRRARQVTARGRVYVIHGRFAPRGVTVFFHRDEPFDSDQLRRNAMTISESPVEDPVQLRHCIPRRRDRSADERPREGSACRGSNRGKDSRAAPMGPSIDDGLAAAAATLAKKVYGCEPCSIDRRCKPTSCSRRLRDRLPAFFKQLRLDVSALYLSDPAIWQRIGFPGPSTASGGYPDFDQPQA